MVVGIAGEDLAVEGLGLGQLALAGAGWADASVEKVFFLRE